jgi:hypothetical protein
MTPTPSPEAVADAMAVAAMGGDLPRLAEVCRARAGGFDEAGRQHLLDAAEAMEWAGRLLAVLDGEGVEDGYVEC